jgi:ABC-2 type transport system ATP-binding protein
MIEVRGLIGQLSGAGTTVFLSTHLLAEAEQLCTEVAVINRGRLVASGPTVDLFATRQQVWVRFASTDERDHGHAALAADGLEARDDGTTTLLLPGATDGAAAIRVLAAAAVYPAEVAVRRPSLEQLYVELTDTRSDANGRVEGGMP